MLATGTSGRRGRAKGHISCRQTHWERPEQRARLAFGFQHLAQPCDHGGALGFTELGEILQTPAHRRQRLNFGQPEKRPIRLAALDRQQKPTVLGRHAPDDIRDELFAHPDQPVVKLFTPDGGCTWLLTEIDPEDPDIAFGLCDLGFGCPELGSVSLSELESVRGQLGAHRARSAFHGNADAVRLRRRGAGTSRDQSVMRRVMTTNIIADHRAVFEALVSDEYRNFALLSCFVNGEPAAAIVAVNA